MESEILVKLKSWNLLIALVVFFGGIWILLSRDGSAESKTPLTAAAHKGFLAPDISLPDQDGDLHQLSSLRGRVVLLNFWASWCTPCKAEMPALEKIFQKYKSQGFQIFSINATNQDNRQAAIDLARSLGISFQILFDENGTAADLYGLRALPTTFIIDPEGKITDVLIGGPISEALLDIRIQQVLKEIQ